MPDFSHFHDVFDANLASPYDLDYLNEINRARKSLDGVLFIDRVLKVLELKKAKAYPPKSDQDLQQLHRQICDSHLSEHHKLAILYYLLLDFDEYLATSATSSKHSSASSRDVASTFATRFSLPSRYEISIRGLWNLDHERYALAVENLTHPSLIPDFADDIVLSLARAAEKAGDGDYSLVLAYWHTIQPVLKTSPALEALFDAMARTSVVDAFWFTRSQGEGAREQLFERLIEVVLQGGSSASGRKQHATQHDVPSMAMQLVSLPLDAEEEQWFRGYLTAGEGRKLRKAKDTLVMRLVVTGRQIETLGETNVGGQWGKIMEGFRQGVGQTR